MLEADLELVAWRSVEDVTPDGGVVTKVRRSSVRLQGASACTGQLILIFPWPQLQLPSQLTPTPADDVGLGWRTSVEALFPVQCRR